MKIDSRTPSILEKKSSIEKKIDLPSVKENPPQLAETPISQKLRETLSAIERLGVTASEAHSGVDEKRAQTLLDTFQINAKRPRLPDEALLTLADKVSSSIKASPETAIAAFNNLNGTRTADLLGGSD